MLHTLRETGCQPEAPETELTESLLLGDIEDAIERMGAARARRRGFALDDFGTGIRAWVLEAPAARPGQDRPGLCARRADRPERRSHRTHHLALAQKPTWTWCEGVETAAAGLLRLHGCEQFQASCLGGPGRWPTWRRSSMARFDAVQWRWLGCLGGAHADGQTSRSSVFPWTSGLMVVLALSLAGAVLVVDVVQNQRPDERQVQRQKMLEQTAATLDEQTTRVPWSVLPRFHGLTEPALKAPWRKVCTVRCAWRWKSLATARERFGLDGAYVITPTESSWRTDREPIQRVPMRPRPHLQQVCRAG